MADAELSYAIYAAAEPISCATCDREELLKLFLDFGADASVTDVEGYSALSWLVKSSSRKSHCNYQGVEHDVTGELFNLLIENDPSLDVHQRDHSGCTLLMQVTAQGSSTYTYLLGIGIDASAVDGFGNNALRHYFKTYYQTIGEGAQLVLQEPATLNSLILAGADPQQCNDFGELPHEVSDRDDHTGEYPTESFRCNLQCIVWYETLQICGLPGIDKPYERHTQRNKEVSDDMSYFRCRYCPSHSQCYCCSDMSFDEKILFLVLHWLPPNYQLHLSSCRRLYRHA